MKTTFPGCQIFPILALTLLFIPALPAQSNTSAESNGVTNSGENQPPPPPEFPHGGPMSRLTKDERQQLKAAHDKAIQQNPALETQMKAAHQAMEEARKAMEAAMIAVDPSVEPILKKIAPPKFRKWMGGDVGNGTNSMCSNAASCSMTSGQGSQGWHGEPPGFAKLTPAEQIQLKAVHEQVKKDPMVVSAHEAVRNAKTPEERYAAQQALHQVMHDAMLKADPSIASILEKLHPQGTPGGQQEPPPPGEGSGANSGGQGMMPPPPPQ